MKTQRLLVALTVLNLGLLGVLLGQTQRVQASDGSVLRGRSLEIVDDQGRVRASIKIQPADEKAAVRYPDTVVLRLINPVGGPGVKIASSSEEAGAAFIGSQGTYLTLGAKQSETSLRLKTPTAERVIKP